MPENRMAVDEAIYAIVGPDSAEEPGHVRTSIKLRNSEWRTILSALRDAGTGRDSGGLAKLLSDAEPTISRRGDDITLQCPGGTITDELFDALEAACYAPDPSHPDARGETGS